MSPFDRETARKLMELTQAGTSGRAISRALHVSRNTVANWVRQHGLEREAPHSVLPSPRVYSRPSKLDPFRTQVDELLRTYSDITAQRVFEILREKGFAGGYSAVKELVRRLRPKPVPAPSLETPPREPGDLAECDWSPYPVSFTHAPPVELQAFGYTLRYSTRKYFGFYERNDLFALMAGHVSAFERFQGVARRCKYDNQKPVVLRWEGGQPIYNPRFIDFATYYEFSPVACRRRCPNDKPRVERSFYELTLSFFRGRSFRDLADLKAQLERWMDTICDLRPLKRMKRRSRRELFAEELPLLRPLPRHPYDTARVLYRLCDIEGFIAWEGNWYSLPYDYVTEILPVRITEKELFVYRPDLTCIARHELLPRGAQQRSVLDGHRPRRADRGPDFDQLRRAFADIGGQAEAFLSALEQVQSRCAGYHARRVLALRERWGTDELARALEHALAYGALEHQSVERILLIRGTPRRLDEYVAQASAEKLDPAYARSGPRDLTEYDALPPQTSPQPTGAPRCPGPNPSQTTTAPKTSSESGSSDTSGASA